MNKVSAQKHVINICTVNKYLTPEFLADNAKRGTEPSFMVLYGRL